MYEILVPLDSSRERERTQISMLTSLPIDEERTNIVLTHVLTDEEERAPKEMRHPERVSVVKEARETLEDRGFSVTVRSCDSPPTEGILDLADKIDADHIILGGRKRSPAGKALFGSVTQGVILDTDRPVTVTGSVPEA